MTDLSDPTSSDPRDRPSRRGGTFSLALTLLGLGLVAFLLLDFRDAAAYWLRPAPVVDLGAPGAYRPDALSHNVPARIEGVAGRVSARFQRWGNRFEVVAVDGTSVLVRRDPQTRAFAPGQRLLAEGRLVRDTEAPEYAPIFADMVRQGGAQPAGSHLYLLLDGEMPRRGWRVPALLWVFAAFVGFNLWSLARFAKARLVPRA